WGAAPADGWKRPATSRRKRLALPGCWPDCAALTPRRRSGSAPPMPVACCPGWRGSWKTRPLRSFPAGPECASGAPAVHPPPKLTAGSIFGGRHARARDGGGGAGGVLGAHRLADLPDSGTLALASALPGLAIWTARRARPARIAGLLRGLAWCLLAAWAGFVFAVSCAQVRLDQTLADGNVDRVSRVAVRVDSLPRQRPDRLEFEAVVLEARPGGVPARIRVRWPAGGWRGPYAPARPPDPPFPEVRPGQVWRMALVLRPVRATQNLHAFDYEAHAFAWEIG